MEIQNTVSPNLYPQKGTDNKKIAIIFIVIVAAVVGGILWFRQSKKTGQTMSAVVERNEPTPTDKPKIDKKSVKIQVLNGTGTPGQAGKAADALKKAGFNGDTIKTDNASDNNHPVTTISAKAGYEDIANDIKTALSSIFDSINLDSSPLGNDNQFDVVVTTGGKKFEVTPSPTTITPTSTPSATLTPTPNLTPSSTL